MTTSSNNHRQTLWFAALVIALPFFADNLQAVRTYGEEDIGSVPRRPVAQPRFAPNGRASSSHDLSSYLPSLRPTTASLNLPSTVPNQQPQEPENEEVPETSLPFTETEAPSDESALLPPPIPYRLPPVEFEHIDNQYPRAA